MSIEVPFPIAFNIDRVIVFHLRFLETVILIKSTEIDAHEYC